LKKDKSVNSLPEIIKLVDNETKPNGKISESAVQRILALAVEMESKTRKGERGPVVARNLVTPEMIRSIARTKRFRDMMDTRRRRFD